MAERYLGAVRCGVRVRYLLCPVRVHSVFTRSVNLVIGGAGRNRGRLVTLHDSTVAASAWSVVLAPEALATIAGEVSVGTLGRIEAGVITIGESKTLSVNTTIADPISLARPAVGLITSDSVEFLATAVAQLPVRAHDKELQQRGTLLVRDCARGQGAPSLAYLLGFGPGLTPAGDDFIVGLLAAAASMPTHPAWAEELVRCLRNQLALSPAPSTDISVHLLYAALDGEFSAPLAELIDDLVAERSLHTITMHAAAVTAIGASSGADTLRGLTVAFRSDRWRP